MFRPGREQPTAKKQKKNKTKNKKQKQNKKKIIKIILSPSGVWLAPCCKSADKGSNELARNGIQQATYINS